MNFGTEEDLFGEPSTSSSIPEQTTVSYHPVQIRHFKTKQLEEEIRDLKEDLNNFVIERDILVSLINDRRPNKNLALQKLENILKLIETQEEFEELSRELYGVPVTCIAKKGEEHIKREVFITAINWELSKKYDIYVNWTKHIQEDCSAFYPALEYCIVCKPQESLFIATGNTLFI